jgi:hypothetical protein
LREVHFGGRRAGVTTSDVVHMGTLASGLRPIAEVLAGAPRVYADANLPAGVVSTLRRELGWDVLFVLEHDDLRRAPDAEHYRRARELGRTLITMDRDFLANRRFPLNESPGVVVLFAPGEDGLIRLLARLDREVLRSPGGEPVSIAGRKIQVVPEAAH